MIEDPQTIQDLANRRQYFRVEDKVSVEITPLKPGLSPAECFELSPEFGLISEFQLLDVESKHLLRSVTDKDKNLGQFLKVMNKKLDALSRVLALSQQSDIQNNIQQINLSEGGIAITCDNTYETDQQLAIKLILLPSCSGLILEGKVLSCRGKQAPYELHIAFTDISEPHQQLIARHIMRVQSQRKSHSSLSKDTD